MRIKPLYTSISNSSFREFWLILFGTFLSIQTLTANAIEYYWEFGDGQFSTEKDPNHQYAQSGIYISRLSIFHDQILIDSKEKTIDLVRPYIESISIENETDELNLSLTVHEQFLESLQLNYVWLIEPTEIKLTGQKVSHTFEEPGNYTVHLSAYFEDHLIYETEENLVLEKNIKESENPTSDSTESGGGAFGWWTILSILLSTAPRFINIFFKVDWQKK